MRFTLSQPNVAAGIPPSFLDLLDRAIEAAKYFKPLDEPATAQLKQMAENRGSLFAREEQSVALNLPRVESPYPNCPHACA